MCEETTVIMKETTIWHPVIIVTLVALSLAGGVLILYATPHGPWAGGDSAEYFHAARNLALGKGLILERPNGTTSPMSLRPPFFSLVLSFAARAGWDLLTATRWLNLGLFTTLLLTVGLGTYLVTRQALLSLTLAVLTLSLPTFVYSYTGAMAEPLFFTLGILGIFGQNAYLRNDRVTTLMISSILMGLAALARYSGTAFVATGVATIVLLSRRPILTRLKHAALTTALGILPLLPWVWTVYHGGDTLGIKEWNFSNLWQKLIPLRTLLLDQAWRLFSLQDFVGDVRYRYKLITLATPVLVLLVLTAVGLWRARWQGRNRLLREPLLRLTLLWGIFATLSLTLYVNSFLFVIAPRPGLNDRSTSPIVFGGLVCLFCLLFYTLKLYGTRWGWKLIPTLVALAILQNSIPHSQGFVQGMRLDGRLYATIAWQTSDVMQVVADLPPDVTLISNESEPITLYTNRPAYDLPELKRKQPLEKYTCFGEDPDDEVQRAFREEGAALVLFNQTLYEQFNQIYQRQTEERLEALTGCLTPFFESLDGAIYFYNAGP
jgi:hypothetical protein